MQQGLLRAATGKTGSRYSGAGTVRLHVSAHRHCLQPCSFSRAIRKLEGIVAVYGGRKHNTGMHHGRSCSRGLPRRRYVRWISGDHNRIPRLVLAASDTLQPGACWGECVPRVAPCQGILSKASPKPRFYKSSLGKSSSCLALCVFQFPEAAPRLGGNKWILLSPF